MKTVERPEFDALVVGGGLVAPAAALALSGSGLRVALATREPRVPEEPARAAGWDSRIYAISPASLRFIEALGAGAALDRARCQPVAEMLIRGDSGAAQLEFSAYHACVPALATIIEDANLRQALRRRLAQSGAITVIDRAGPQSLHAGERCARVVLDDGRALEAALVVGADGADSWVRAAAGFAFRGRDYGSSAVVANFRCGQRHHDAARQWFLGAGVLALLPLPDHHLSMVWSVPDALAGELVALSPAALARRVEQATGLGEESLACVTPARAFELRLRRALPMVAARIALVGDAAHLVHPLAGQGLNLGFGDCAVLAGVLAARGPQPDCGDAALLRRYARRRAEPIAAMAAVTDGLQRLFSTTVPGLRWLRNTGLSCTDRLPLLKKRLIAAAIG